MTEGKGDQLSPIVGQIGSRIQPGLPFRVHLPLELIPQTQALAGRYFLVRCCNAAGIERGDDWSILLRRPLFACGRQQQDQVDSWQLYLPADSEKRGAQTHPDAAQIQHSPDAGFEWLAHRVPGELLNLLGPFGNGFTLRAEPHNLLLLVDIREDPVWFWQLLPLCEQALDRGGRVTILFRAENDEPVANLVPWLPLQVEVSSALSEGQWLEQLGLFVGWADQVCAGVRPSSYRELLGTVRNARFQIDRNFAQVVVRADLLCGVGACLVCTVPTARGGLTRACVHGPVFDLTDLVE